MRIALAHDSFTQSGGAERVVEALHELFPDAPVFTLVCSREFKDKYHGWDIRTSWLQVLYNFVPRLQYLLPLIPLATSSLDFEGYDLVISSSSGWIKNIKTPKNCININYCHTPTRFLWVDKDYINQEVPKILQPIVRPIINWMRKWDYKGAQGVKHFIANSKEVQNRILDIYKRTSAVIHPFIDTEFWKPAGQKQDYFLIAGRLQAHKHNDLIIEIFNELGLPLHVVGTGRQEKYLKSIAKDNIKFFGRVPDEQLRDEYSGALGYIFPQLEDFGLMPLEAAACGTATLAFGKGGALETVIPGVTGELYGVAPRHGAAADDSVPRHAATSAQVKDQIKRLILSWNPQKYTLDNLRAHAEKFSKNKFKQEITAFINHLSS